MTLMSRDLFQFSAVVSLTLVRATTLALKLFYNARITNERSVIWTYACEN